MGKILWKTMQTWPFHKRTVTIFENNTDSLRKASKQRRKPTKVKRRTLIVTIADSLTRKKEYERKMSQLQLTFAFLWFWSAILEQLSSLQHPGDSNRLDYIREFQRMSHSESWVILPFWGRARESGMKIKEGKRWRRRTEWKFLGLW